MKEYCVTVGIAGDTDTELYHAHVIAPTDGHAVEAVFEQALEKNVSLAGMNVVSIHILLDVPADVMAGYEALRALRHVGKPAATPPAQQSSHLH